MVLPADPIQLATHVARWDADYESALAPGAPPEALRPYDKVLRYLTSVESFKYEPYQNDVVPSFREKLRLWIAQFPPDRQRFAFLVAARIVTLSLRQFEVLQRRLFMTFIRRELLEAVAKKRSLPLFKLHQALPHLADELDATLFIPNSDSAHLNSFVHLNAIHFQKHGKRRLLGPSRRFWTYAATRAKHFEGRGDPVLTEIARAFHEKVVCKDPLLRGKRRLVVIEDFSGTGADLEAALDELFAAQLPFQDIVLAPVVSTEAAADLLRPKCAALSRRGRTSYSYVTALTLPHSLRCFDGPVPSYLDGHEPERELSKRVRDLSEAVYTKHFQSVMDPSTRHGFGGLALAFVMYFNIPDNSLPLFWQASATWKPVFPRVSRYI